jgi:hypothetical protein
MESRKDKQPSLLDEVECTEALVGCQMIIYTSLAYTALIRLLHPDQTIRSVLLSLGVVPRV